MRVRLQVGGSKQRNEIAVANQSSEKVARKKPRFVVRVEPDEGAD